MMNTMMILLSSFCVLFVSSIFVQPRSALAWSFIPQHKANIAMKNSQTIKNNKKHDLSLFVRPATSTTRLGLSNDDDNESNDSITAGVKGKAEELRQSAAKAREEAEKLESTLALQRIDTLEKMLEKLKASKNDDESNNDDNLKKQKQIDDASDKIKALKKRLEPSSSPIISGDGDSISGDEMKEETEEERVERLVDEVMEEMKEEEEFVADLTDDDKKALSEIQNIFSVFSESFADVPIDSGDGVDTLNKTELDEIQRTFDEMISGNVTKDDLEFFKTVSGALNFFQSNFNVSLADQLKKDAELSKGDPRYFDKKDAMTKSFGASLMFNGANVITDEDVDTFVNEVLDDPTIFARTAKPRQLAEKVFMIDGSNKLKDGDEMVQRLQAKFDKSSIKDRVTFFYVRDPTYDLDLDEVQMTDMINPGDSNNPIEILEGFVNIFPGTILLTGRSENNRFYGGNNENNVPVLVDVACSSIGLISIIAFAGSCYVQQVTTNAGMISSEDVSLIDKILIGISSPSLTLGILATQLSGELAHLIAAFAGKFRTSLPSILPSADLGCYAFATRIESPPKNWNASFDYSVAGPLVGFIISIGLFVLGLQNTISMDTSSIAELPRLSNDVLKLSTLASAIVESFVGTDVWLSLDPTSTLVPCHPFVIAGYTGIILNALSILPFDGTDGGRMTQAIFGRQNFAIRGFLGAGAFFFLLVEGFREFDTSSILLIYLLYLNFFLSDQEIPCLNDVDKASGPRFIIYMLMNVLAITALFPVV